VNLRTSTATAPREFSAAAPLPSCPIPGAGAAADHPPTHPLAHLVADQRADDRGGHHDQHEQRQRDAATAGQDAAHRRDLTRQHESEEQRILAEIRAATTR